MRRSGGGGYALVELLVAVALLALVGAALVGAFAGGLRVWERARSEARDAGPAALAFEQMGRDLANACLSRDIAFQGTSEGLTCALRLDRPELGVETLGVLCYSYDSDAQQIRRTLRPAGGQGDEGAEAVLDRVEAVAFFYYEAGAASGGGWMDSWTGRTNLPAALRVRVRREEGGQPVERQRTVLCPTG